MIAKSLFATTVMFLGIAIFLLQECNFLIPYRHLLWARYGVTILGFASLLFVNLFALIHLFARKLLLKNTGEKLAHVEKQLRTGPSISEELSRRLNE